MNPLVEFAVKREAIRKKKAAGEPAPWTDDPIFQYRFTNVRRRDDRVSCWINENVLSTLGSRKTSLEAFLMFSALCRWVNWPPTIALLMARGFYPVKQLDLLAIGKFIDKQTASGIKTWTGAYLVRAKPGDKKGKGRFVAVEVIKKPLTKIMPQLLQALSAKTRSRKEIWELLYNCHNWGSFSAGQVVDDWSWTKLLASASDHYTWTPQGPGSLRGFNRVLGLPLKTRHSEEEWCNQLQVWRHEIIAALGKGYEDLTLADVQSCLCETDKYLRTMGGEGRPRSKYRSESAF